MSELLKGKSRATTDSDTLVGLDFIRRVLRGLWQTTPTVDWYHGSASLVWRTMLENSGLPQDVPIELLDDLPEDATWQDLKALYYKLPVGKRKSSLR